tara:strand:+ start:1544 stop:1900 length:357 start_codon:yes stop_codon:yes gene_type:complete
MDQGAFIYKDSLDKDICLLMFKHLSEEQFKSILPDIKEGVGNYLIAMFKNDTNYLGRTEYEGITRLMNDEDMINIFSSFEDIQKKIPELTEEQHYKYIDVVKMQYQQFGIQNISAGIT